MVGGMWGCSYYKCECICSLVHVFIADTLGVEGGLRVVSVVLSEMMITLVYTLTDQDM